MRVLLAQINPRVGDISGNKKKILEGLQAARDRKVDLVVFPELALSGYPPEDFVLMSHFIDDLEKALTQIIEATQDLVVLVGTVRRHAAIGEKRLCNSAAVIENKNLLGFQDKILLPTYDVFNERRFFEPAPQLQLWEICGYKVGITICEDIWQHSEFLKESNYTRDPVKEMALLAPELMINLSASPFSMNKWSSRLQVCSLAVKTLRCPLLLCNQIGGNDSLIFDGNSLYMDANGVLIQKAKEFEEDYLLIDLKAKLSTNNQVEVDSFKTLYRALVLGIRDYFQKSGFSKACFGLSGGIDSALVACLAVEALGKENVLAVLMPSRYTSVTSFIDARQLIDRLGIPSEEISIEGPFSSFLDSLTPIFLEKPWDATEENLQARIRGIILMALSNKLGYLVLSTGNKSELAMGYSTLYGDMCGGLAVISDLTKQQVYSLAHWINRQGEVIPKNILEKPPSAELRFNQKDSDSLPDYAIIDNVLEAYLEQHLSPALIAKRFNYPIDLVQNLIKRIHCNEYKRRQSPPGLRVSEKAFSIGRQFPIVQGYV